MNEEVFDELKNNNRYIDTLWIWNNHQYDFDPLNIDWGREGDSLADNTHLKSLDISCRRESPDNAREQRYAERNAKAFYRALSKNKSIKYLKIRGCIGNLAMSDTLSILSPFIENNTKLRSLELGGCIVNDRFALLFESALLRCNTSLQRIELNRCEGMTADIMEKIINVVGSQGIQELYLDEYDWDDEVAAALGDTLCTNNTLKVLSLGGEQFDHQQGRIGSMDSTGVEAITEFLSTPPSSSLKELSFRNNQIGPLGGIALAEALEGNTTLKRLDLYSAVSPWYGEHTLTSQGWTTFFESLHNCAFHSLNLGGNTIEDGDVASMVEALNSFSSLETLNLRKATSITSSGWVAFFNLLAQPGSALERLKKLDIEGSSITDEVMISIANALVNSISLKKLGWCHQERVADRGWSALTNILCNKTTIETICNSNHTLLRVGIISPGKVNKLTRLNNGTNKAEVARQKIIRCYFLEGKGSNLHEIMNMDFVLLPHVIECFGKQAMEVPKGTYGSARIGSTKYTIKVDSGFELLYRLARGMPSLFDTRGKVLGGKRKRKA